MISSSIILKNRDFYLTKSFISHFLWHYVINISFYEQIPSFPDIFPEKTIKITWIFSNSVKSQGCQAKQPRAPFISRKIIFNRFVYNFEYCSVTQQTTFNQLTQLFGGFCHFSAEIAVKTARPKGKQKPELFWRKATSKRTK